MQDFRSSVPTAHKDQRSQKHEYRSDPTGAENQDRVPIEARGLNSWLLPRPLEQQIVVVYRGDEEQRHHYVQHDSDPDASVVFYEARVSVTFDAHLLISFVDQEGSILSLR